MNKKNLIVFIATVSVIAAVIILFFCSKTKNGKFVTTKVIEKTIVQSVEATGTVNPVQTVSIGSQISGIIKEIYVDYNTAVKKGQLLALIDPALIQAQVAQSTASLNAKKADYQRAQSTLAYDAAKYARYNELYKKDYISKDDMELAKADYLAQKAITNAASAEIKQAQATLQNNLTNLSYTRIISPVDGVVISKEVDVGQTVAASFQTPTLFTVAQDLRDMQIETSVSEADIGKVKVGQDVEYTLDGYPDKVFIGKVSQVRLASTTTNNVVTYTVIIDVDNDDGVLLPGMTANVEIITSKHENVLVVPNLALKFTPDKNGKKYDNQGIWIFEKGKLKRVDVTVGTNDDAHTEIISDKIKKDTIVVISSKNSKKNTNSTRRMGPPPM